TSRSKTVNRATAEQIRLAQMISDHNDADFEEKVKQLIDITGKDQDESMIALHDCNGDVNRAINVLLEGSPDTDSWEMVGKKKGVSGQKESGQTDGGEEGKENRERGGERDVARRRGGASRRGRGASRGREFRGQENGLDGAKTGGVAGRGTERGRRGRGRGRGLSCFFLTEGSTFNPADYAEPAQTEESYAGGSTWSNTGNLEPEDGARIEFTGGEGTNYPQKFDSAPGAWRTGPEEWGTEDWNEDLSETKIFTASSVAAMPMPQENVTITAGQRIDLAVLLGKTPPSSSSETEATPLETQQPPSLSQSLVFSNSKQPVPLSQPTSNTSYSQHSMVSMLSKGFGEVGDTKGNSGSSTSGSQFLEQFKTAQALAQLAAQHSQSGPPNTGPSTWDTSPATLGQYETLVHSPFTKRQPYQPTSTASSMMDAFLQDKGPPPSTASSLSSQSTPSASLAQTVSTPLPKPSGPAPSQQISPGPAELQASSPLPLQQHKLKQQKKRTSIATKIPALAVEMPGSADISGLNLQFGALQFGSEPVLPEYDATAAVPTTLPGNPAQNSVCASRSHNFTYMYRVVQAYVRFFLLFCLSDYLRCSMFLDIICKLFRIVAACLNEAFCLSEQTPALSTPTQMELYEQRTSQTRRYPPSVSSSPQKDMQPKVRLFYVSMLILYSNKEMAYSFIDRFFFLRFITYCMLCCAFGAHCHLYCRKAPPNLPPGVPPLLPNPYIMAPGLLHAYPPQVYGYDDLQMLQTRIPLDYYSIPFATPTTALTGREGGLTSNPYSAGDLTKFGRGDTSSPAPATTLAQPQQSQSQTHHTTQQPFLNPALPPGYSYTSLPYYTGVPGLPNTFQYGPAMFPVAPTSSKQHGVNVGVNASATPFQQASGYGSHGYGTGVSVTSSNTGVPDISGSVYTKTQSFDKQAFHTGTPGASFSLPSALGSGGPINPPAAAGYAPAPFMHILTPHQQPHSQMLHHHLQQDGQVRTSYGKL
uniref:UBA domain-containing protein n=1 Tax=Pygocentrus nattereri TaxID=42514 RepID=A0AAR2LZM0_PYGNA